MSKAKSRSKRKLQADNEFLQEALNNNGAAMSEGRKKKHWTKHDLITIKPLTPTQEDMFHAYLNDDNVCAFGSAGTGKTFIGLYLALNTLLEKNQPYQKIIIVRSTVATRDVGFMPGNLDEKNAVYELPYADIISTLTGKSSTYTDMKNAGLIEFMSTSFIRGLTWDNCIVIVDEMQNMNWHEINSVMTRIGENSRVLLLGDLIQTDLIKNNRDISGMERTLNTVRKISNFSMIEFNVQDIVRGELVKSWIIASENT